MYNLSSCSSCNDSYELVNIFGEERELCKLKYEIDPDFYSKNFNVYYEKIIYSIKMLYSPIANYSICQKNEKTIFYFEWLFDLYDNNGTQLILNW